MSTGPPIICILLVLASSAVFGIHIESISANIDRKVSHETFMPLVAFKCGFRNKHLNESGMWQDDASSAATCLEGKLDILKYCKRVYPNKKITNIVEYGHISHIDNWCRENGRNCKNSFTTRPYRCIEGDFIADSLQVPSRCKFGHVSERNTCDDYNSWNKKAQLQCRQSLDDEDKKNMKLHSFATLDPCGLGLFRGVEYVCCPRSVENTLAEEKEEEYSDNEEINDDEEDEEDDDDDASSNDIEDKSKDDEQDPYFDDEPSANEHERFKEAQERLEKKYRSKVAKVITEWSELFERYSRMKEKDPKGAETYKFEMTGRFRKTVASLEEENREQRRQLEELHDERVQTALNERKRKATHDYRMELAIQVSHVNKNNVLGTLKEYIRAEEKDRSHMLNRYRHLLRTNPKGASSFEPMLMHRLHYIDLRINGTLQMLRDFPDLEKQIRPIAVDYWLKYRRDNTPEVDLQWIGKENDAESIERLIQLYKNNAEKKNKETRIESTFSDIVKTSHKDTVNKKKLIPLKDLMNEKVDNEDSDEEQFEVDEEDDDDVNQEDELIQTRPIVLNETANSEALKQKRKLPTEKTKPKNVINADKNVEKTINHFEEDEDDDDDDDDSDDITPLDTEKVPPSELIDQDQLFLRKEVNLAYARHNQLMADDTEQLEHSNNGWTTQSMLMVYSTLVLCVLVAAGLVLRRRPSQRGFTEVDVCNPEDYHVNKMQVNGYENPTYSFYDTKP